MSLNPLKLIENLINEHGSSSILKERLRLLKEQLSDLIKERADLQTKLSKCMEEMAQMAKKIEQKSVPPEFTEYLGALFKRDSSNRYTPVVYCPECKIPLWNNEPAYFPYECSKCGFKIDIHESLTSIAEKLNKQI